MFQEVIHVAANVFTTDRIFGMNAKFKARRHFSAIHHHVGQFLRNLIASEFTVAQVVIKADHLRETKRNHDFQNIQPVARNQPFTITIKGLILSSAPSHVNGIAFVVDEEIVGHAVSFHSL